MEVDFFLYRFRKIFLYQINFVKIPSVGAEFHATDGRRQTDMTKLTVAFRNFANAPKNDL